LVHPMSTLFPYTTLFRSQGTHTYHVGVGDEDILVHNCKGRVNGPLPDFGQTSLYALINNRTSEILKWGISRNPLGRYTCRCLREWNARMEILHNFDSRADALQAERYMTERFPGPLNFEPHAGSVSPDSGWEESLNFVRGGGLWSWW